MIGDDLNFAQKFTRTAANGLALIVEMDDPRAANDAAVVIDMMTTVQRGAKRLRARHIYTGAQDVLSALHHEDDATLHGRIKNLGCLVTEYARGLEDLLQAPKPSNDQSPMDKWEVARNTLNDLLPGAEPETADMLSRLMRAPVTIETVHPETIPASTREIELPQVIENEALDTGSEEFRSMSNLGQATPAKLRTKAKPDEIDVTLDSMMRDVIADALTVARSVGRTISLSYDMGNRTISEFRAAELRGRLGKSLSQIIRQSLTNDRVGHIDINLAGDQLHIMAGTTALRVPIDPKPQPSSEPRITKETEQGLRAQLNALMDPISLHETAS